MRVIFFDTADRLAHGNARRMPTLDALLEQADVVSLHVDGRPGNAGLFGADQFARMKPRSMFINASRGMVVDDVALRAHIESGHLAGAALDVFPVEPKAQGDTFESVLRGLDNVILTPHVGGSTQEAQEEIGWFVAGKLADVRRRGQHRALGRPARRPAAAAHRGSPARLPAHQRARRARRGERLPRRAGRQRRGPVPRHPRRAGVRRHRRHRDDLAKPLSTSCARRRRRSGCAATPPTDRAQAPTSCGLRRLLLGSAAVARGRSGRTCCRPCAWVAFRS